MDRLRYDFNFNQLTKEEHGFENRLLKYIKFRNIFDSQSYVMSDRQPFAYFGENEKVKILSLFNQIPQFKKEIQERCKLLIGKEVDYHQLKKWSKKVPAWRKGIEKLKDPVLWRIWKNSRSYQLEQPEWLAEYVEVSENENATASITKAEKKWLNNKRKELEACFLDGGMEKFTSFEDILSYVYIYIELCIYLYKYFFTL